MYENRASSRFFELTTIKLMNRRYGRIGSQELPCIAVFIGRNGAGRQKGCDLTIGGQPPYGVQDESHRYA